MKVARKIFIIILGILLLSGWSAYLSAQTAASAGIDEGYSASALEKILKSVSTLNMPGKQILVQVSVDGQGKITGCTPRKSSGSRDYDNSICDKIKAVSNLGVPPYAQPAEVAIAFFNTLPASQGASVPAQTQTVPKTASKSLTQDTYPQKYQAYLKKITRELRNSIYIPAESKAGTYYPVARIKINKQGKILSSEIINGSGDKTMDKYVLQGIKRADHVSAPPEGLGSTLDLTFQLVR